MALTFIAGSTALVVPGTSVTVTVPAGTADGDLMLAMVGGDTAAITAPAGWTLIDGYALRPWWVWYRIASGEPANYVWTFASDYMRGIIVTYRNPSTSPIGPRSKQKTVSASHEPLTITLASITPAEAGRELLLGWCVNDRAPKVWTLPGGFTTDYSTGGTKPMIVGGITCAGGVATGTRDVTCADVNAYSGLYGLHLAVYEQASAKGLPILALHWAQQFGTAVG